MIDDLVAFQQLNRFREANQRGIYVCHIQLAVLQEIGFDHRHCSKTLFPKLSRREMQRFYFLLFFLVISLQGDKVTKTQEITENE